MKRTLILTALIAFVGAAVTVDESQARRIKNKLVKSECGECHMAFQPSFLPAESWRIIMDDLENHFGDDASVDEKDAVAITNYLVKHAGRKRRRKKGQPPLRITKLRWFVREHNHEVSRRAKRRAGTMSNCTACHRGADKGYYDDD